MSSTATTPFSDRCEVLSTIWESLDNKAEFIGFVREWGDFALPLANAVANDLATVNELGALHINKAWESLCQFLDLPENKVADFVYDFLD